MTVCSLLFSLVGFNGGRVLCDSFSGSILEKPSIVATALFPLGSLWALVGSELGGF